MRRLLHRRRRVGGFRLTIRDAEQYTETRLLIVAYLLMVATGCGVYFVGVFSPAPMAGTLGIYFLSLGSSRIAALSSYIMGTLMHGIPAVLIAAGVIGDPGLFRDFGSTGRDKLVVALLVQVVFFLTYVLARLSRRATRQLIEKLHAALAQVQKREALLSEAHHELDRALASGRPGRYSDRQLGPFRLGPVIGRGAMSEIYRAARIDDGRPAAVKVLHRDLLSSEQHRRRFQREAEIIAALRCEPHGASVQRGHGRHRRHAGVHRDGAARRARPGVGAASPSGACRPSA